MSYLDDVGVRKELFLRLDQRFNKIGQDGAPYSVHKLVNKDGLKVMFYRYSGDVSFNEKDCILVKATVADHRVYKEEPETYLNRVKVLKNVGSK